MTADASRALFALQVLPDGTTYYEAEGSYTQTVSIDGGCVNDWCSSLDWAHEDPFDASAWRSECEEGGQCGSCTCPIQGEPSGSGTAGWSPTSLSLPGGYADYCLIGDTLQLHGGRLLYEFEPLDLGTPLPCAERSPETCATGSGCMLGLCEGSAPECAGADESTCEESIYCVWTPDACVGEPTAPCTLPDRGIVPGCQEG